MNTLADIFEQVEIQSSQFDKAVEVLENNLAYLTSQGKVAKSFLAIQRSVLTAVTNYRESVQQFFDEAQAIEIRTINEKKDLKLHIEKLEAIALLHGITDLPIWLNKNTSQIVLEIKEAYKYKYFKIPAGVIEGFTQLPQEHKNQLQSCLDYWWKMKYTKQAAAEQQEYWNQLSAGKTALEKMELWKKAKDVFYLAKF